MLELKDHDMIIKWVGLELSHLVEYPTLTRYEPDTLTRINTLNYHHFSPLLFKEIYWEREHFFPSCLKKFTEEDNKSHKMGQAHLFPLGPKYK